MKNDPCALCILPDCDIEAAGCMMRQLANAYCAKRKARRLDTVTETERIAAAGVYHFWNLERLALASEGVRPYDRKGSPWRPSDPRPIGTTP